MNVRPVFRHNLGDLIFTKRKGDSVHQWWHEDIALKALPKKAFKKKGKLVIPQVRPGDKGLYIYEDKTKQGKKIKNKNLNISSHASTLYTPDPTLYTSDHTFYTPAPTNYKKFSEADIDLPLCENDTIHTGGKCRVISLFECNDGQRVNKSLRCNRKRDCNDGSDEVNCEFWPPKITQLPELKVDLYCGTDENDKFDMLRLDCEFVGHPEPLVKWKKYEGHVPSKCQQVSTNGHGILLCPNFKQSDQGAYSCVAENSIGSSESQPKSIARCKNFIPCNGFKVKNEEDIEHCLECFCSGKTDRCQNIKSKLQPTVIPFPVNLVTLNAKDDGEITYIPSDEEPTPKNLLNEIKYYELTKDYLPDNSLLKSYGRNMRIPRYSGKTNFLPEVPDLIIQGNGISLFYNFHVISPSSNTADVRFWPGNWHHLNKTVASRLDLMSVLSSVDRFLFRCEYVKNNVENWSNNAHIHLESSTIGDFLNSVSYLEKCTCPEGYAGLSCESCATGYQRRNKISGFVCDKIQCDSRNGYFLSGNECVKSPCNVNGSLNMFPDFDGKCKCKEGMTGDTCNQPMSCESGYYRIDNSKECVKCWCSGVTHECNGSSLYRTEISSMSMGGYNSSNGRNFWLLPGIFSGNKLTSYGGHIKYALTYVSDVPKQNEPLSVELLTVDDVTLTFTHPNIDKSTVIDEKTWVVPMKENYWRKSDKTAVNRSEFLSVLTELKAIYIESPYHLSSGKVNLTWVRMSDASQIDKGTNEYATEVEQCFCPEGYTGFSCESCAHGYYREKTSNKCVKCYCDNCDPIEGCLGCPTGFYRDNPSTEARPVCKPCDCNEREVKCGKDTNNNTYCLCKSGFSGLHCENSIAFTQSSSHLTIKITPSILTSDAAGSEAVFNCSYDSGEKLKLSFTKVYRDKVEGPFSGTAYPVITTKNGYQGLMSVSTLLEEELTEVECYVHNLRGKEVGRVVATIQTIGTQPVKITNCYSDYTYVKETKSKDFICQTTGSPRPVTTWYMKKHNEPREKVDSTDGVYSIGAVELSQNGTTFTCEAENSVGDKDICSTVLIVEKNCDVVRITPKKVQVEEGETIYLHCTTTANSSVSWLREDSILPLRRTYESNGNLTILNATLEDIGNYTCRALSSDNRYINQTVWVNVTEKLVAPLIFISSNDVTLSVGDHFTVDCWVSGKPTPTVVWTKLSGSPAKNVYSFGGNLTITSASLDDAGIYECQAQSKAGREVSRIYIDVKEIRRPPKVEISPTSISPIEGQSTMVECRATSGKPEPRIYWLREVILSNGEFQNYGNNSVLEFRNISRYDRGIYQCRGENSEGIDVAYVEIDVMFPPNITVSDESMTVYENEEITIKCSAVGNPVPKLTWLSQLQGNQKRDIRDNDVLAVFKNEITITVKATADLYGLICLATNEVGEARKIVPVSVWPELVVQEQDVQMVPIGSYHEFLCHGCHGKLQWEKVDGQLVGDECEIPNGLMIPAVQIQHNATYACTCTADKKFKKTFSIIVTGHVPKFTQDPKSYIVLPVSLKSSSEAVIEISFKTYSEHGLLLMDEYNEFALYVYNNKTTIILHPEGGKRHHFTSTVHLKHGVWYSLVVDLTVVSAKITLYADDSRILEQMEEHFKNFTGKLLSSNQKNFFVGGTKHKAKNAHHHLLHIPSLDGCISRLNIDYQPYNIIKQGTYSTSVSLCKRCSEQPNPCKNQGKCLDAPTQFGFICVCPENPELGSDVFDKYNHQTNMITETCPSGCEGRNCDRQLDLCKMMNPCYRSDLNLCTNKVSSLSCSCSLGYQGLTCEKEELNSFCVSGTGYVKLSSKHLYQSSLLHPEVIEMQFSLEKPNGLLLWRGDLENYVAITVTRGFVNYIYQNQGIVRYVTAGQKIELYRNHTLIAKRTNDTIILQLDDQPNIDYSRFTTNRVVGDIYLGGTPQHILPYNISTSGLFGCIHSLSFGRQPRINFKDNVLESLNIRPLKSQIFRNRVQNNLKYDRMESESDDDDISTSDY
ncbi:hypothetical protein RUM44_001928 [Polyplax serrata]|uniref:Uncharacterized protein n=1 Tax=Polyplax serrata TaxID=468196 RepID=A0ABR1ALF3_POLSC